MRRTGKIIIILLLVIAVLISIDILTGIYFWNRSNLEFDASEFNNLVTPLAAIFSAIISSIALILALQQNIVIRSQHLRPYYEKEIDRYVNSLQAKSLRDEILPEEYHGFNGLTFMKQVGQIKVDLTNNQDYL